MRLVPAVPTSRTRWTLPDPGFDKNTGGRVLGFLKDRAFGVDDDAASSADRAGGVHTHRKDLVDNGVGACQHEFVGPIRGCRLDDVDDELGAHPGQVPTDFREPCVVADRQSDPPDLRHVDGDHSVTGRGPLIWSPWKDLAVEAGQVPSGENTTAVLKTSPLVPNSQTDPGISHAPTSRAISASPAIRSLSRGSAAARRSRSHSSAGLSSVPNRWNSGYTSNAGPEICERTDRTSAAKAATVSSRPKTGRPVTDSGAAWTAATVITLTTVTSTPSSAAWCRGLASGSQPA